MTASERWQRIKAVFDAAADMPVSDRRSYLDAQCSDDAELRREVESLLASHAEDDFLEQPASTLLGIPAFDAGATRIGGRVGPYRLLRVIGAGGMGVVFEAERADDQFQKRVAIKLIKRGMDSELMLQRFRQERQILAALQHRNIASLLDGGVTDEGQPYLVMEFVAGEPINTYAARRELALADKLRLFRGVCAAVHFAHQNLVVHRDLKPTNILVSESGDVKLLDFGVAKLLRTDVDTTAPLTLAGDRVLTPAYASPEQIRGEQATTAADVYSLGVVLYELLAGRIPFDVSDSSLPELERLICNETPSRPSAAVREKYSTDAEQASARVMGRKLSGELDDIVLMAMRKEPDRRYASVAAFSDDIGRYLEGRPVLAQGDTASYRLRKFVQRHRIAVAGAVLVLLTLVGGAATTLWQARRADAQRRIAEQHLADVRALARTLIFDVHDAIADIPGATAARELVVQRATEYLDKLAEQSISDPALLREVAEAYLRLAMVQGSPMGANRGDLPAARTALKRALNVANSALLLDSADLASRRGVALVQEKLGDIEAWSGDLGQGVTHAHEALRGFEAIAHARPADIPAQLSAVISHVKLADLLGNPNYPNLGLVDSSIAVYRVARARLDALPLAGSSDAGVVRYNALVHERLGSMFRVVARFPDALEAFGKALAIREQTAAGSTRSVSAARDVAVTLQNLCEVRRRMDDLSGAVADCERAMGLFQQLYSADSGNVQTIEDMARINATFAGLSASRGDLRAAATQMERCVAYRDLMAEQNPANAQNRRLLALALLDAVPHYAGIVRAGGAGTGEAARKAQGAFNRASRMLEQLESEGAAGEPETRALAAARTILSDLPR